MLEDIHGEMELRAYVVSEQTISGGGLREWLAGLIPDYMIPSWFVQIAELPLTANGKVDTRALPLPDSEERLAANAYIVPKNDLEIQLIEVWEKVLDRNPIGMKDNFFELGRHSLKAIRLMAQIYKKLGIELDG